MDCVVLLVGGFLVVVDVVFIVGCCFIIVVS